MRKILTLKLLGILLVLTCSMQAQQKTVEGTVTDEAGFPLAGATIAVKGTTTGASADFDGNYSLTVNENATLVVSYVGYITLEVSVAGKTTINVTLQEDVSQLNEVVVVGFGTQKKESVTGATSFVKMEKIIADRPVVNATDALQGIASGLGVTIGSGQPGNTATSINIRGFTSINGGSPLILINNVPGNLEDINPRDIESISVLKDASASSIYGARAAFGVVIITTKSAKRNEKTKFEYSTTTSVSRPSDLPEKATTREFVEALAEWGEQSYFAGQNVQDWLGYLDMWDNDPSQLNLVKDPITGQTYPIHYDGGQHYPLADSNIIGDFLDHFGYSTIHNFGISGGADKLAYRVNTGYSYEDGIMVTNRDNFKKYNINALLDADISNSLKSTTNILYRSSVQSRPNAQYSNAIQLRMYDPIGWFEYEDQNETLIAPFDTPGNVVRYSEPGKTYVDNLRLFQKVEWKPFKNLVLTGEYTYEKNNRSDLNVGNGQRYISSFRFNPTITADNVFTNSSIFRGKRQTVYNGLNLYGKYNLELGGHNFKLLAGINREQEDFEGLFASRNGLIDPTTPTFELAEGESIDISESFYQWAVVGYFGRFNYNFKERYFLEANLRYDGSSRFAQDDRYVVLPSFSAGWNIAKEPFMENVGFISLLKPRASWGEIGNQRTVFFRTNTDDYYPTIPGYSPYSARWINLETNQQFLTFNPAQLVSAGLTWEKVVTSNLGLDIGMFNNRLNASFEVYKRETIGMLTEGQPLPNILGTIPPLQNAADLETSGWEASLGWNDRIGDDFTYSLNINVFDNTSEITKFENPGGLISDFYVGQQLGEIWGYVTDGFYTVDDFVEGTLDADLAGDNRQLKPGVATFTGNVPYPGDVKFKDLDGDGFISSGNGSLITELDDQGNPITNSEGVITTGPGDRKVIGNSRKRYQFGINGYMAYKGFDMSFVLNGVGKEDGWRSTDLIWPFPGTFDNIYKHQLDYWTPDNQDAYYPRIYGNAAGGNNDSNYGRSRRAQTKYLSDESYLRIQNITLGYSLNDSKLLNKLNIDKFRIFVSGNNIHTFDKLPKGLDVDQGSNGVYPIMEQYSIGFNLTF